MRKIAFFLFASMFYMLCSAESEAAVKEYTWKFRGKEYSLQLNLSDVQQKKYQERPNRHPATQKLEDYYEGIITPNKGDETMRMVAGQLMTKAGLSGFSSLEQQLEFIVGFVQSAIKTDYPRAHRAIIEGLGRPNCPFETLYTGKGVCIDKSLLLIAIIRNTGYWGSCLLYYPNAFGDVPHTAVGIECSNEFALYNSGFCFVETMLELPIGVMSKMNNQAEIVPSTGLFVGCYSNFGRVKTLLIMDGIRKYNPAKK